MKRAASDIDTNDRPLKRAKADSEPTSTSGFASLTKDILTEISHHLDVTGINAMFSTSKSMRNYIGWHEPTTQEFWAQLVLRKYPGFELKLAEDDEGPLPWRNIYIGTERKLIPGTQRLQKYLTLISHDPKLSEAEKLINTRSILAKLEFLQTLLEQVNNFLDKHPTMRNFWESRVMYTQHKVFAGLEWSVDNYKWDVTSTAPVDLTVIGKNGEALFLNALTSSFACYWAYGTHELIKHSVMSVTEVSSAMQWEDSIDKALLPKTPQEDKTEDHIINSLVAQGYKKHLSEEDWKEILEEIGLSDVDPKLFAGLIECAVFPAQKGVSYCTETLGYYTLHKPYVDRNSRLPGVGGQVPWGAPKKKKSVK